MYIWPLSSTSALVTWGACVLESVGMLVWIDWLIPPITSYYLGLLDYYQPVQKYCIILTTHKCVKFDFLSPGSVSPEGTWWLFPIISFSQLVFSLPGTQFLFSPKDYELLLSLLILLLCHLYSDENNDLGLSLSFIIYQAQAWSSN